MEGKSGGMNLAQIICLLTRGNEEKLKPVENSSYMSVKFSEERLGSKAWAGVLKGRRSNLTNWYIESQIGEKIYTKQNYL